MKTEQKNDKWCFKREILHETLTIDLVAIAIVRKENVKGNIAFWEHVGKQPSITYIIFHLIDKTLPVTEIWNLEDIFFSEKGHRSYFRDLKGTWGQWAKDRTTWKNLIIGPEIFMKQSLSSRQTVYFWKNRHLSFDGRLAKVYAFVERFQMVLWFFFFCRITFKSGKGLDEF